MKKAAIILVSLLSSFIAKSQGRDSVMLGMLRLNFVVPDMPAFKAMGTDPSAILRPSTAQAFAVSVSEFYQNGQFALPTDFAMELTPSLLLNATRPIENVIRSYSKAQWLKTFRVSIGTAANRAPHLGRSMAIGLRSNLINKGDMTTDKAYLQNVVMALGDFRMASRKALATFAHQHGIDTNKVDYEFRIMSNPVLKTKFDDLLFDMEAQRVFMAKLDSLKQDYKLRNWNAQKLDVAFAVVGSGGDSLLKNVQLNKYAFWMTWALRAGKSGQVLLGINAEARRDNFVVKKQNEFYTTVSLPLRYMSGSNRLKGYAELQYQYVGIERSHYSFLSLGAEVNPYDGFWVSMYGGINHNYTNAGTSFVTNLNLKITLPESFKLF